MRIDDVEESQGSIDPASEEHDAGVDGERNGRKVTVIICFLFSFSISSLRIFRRNRCAGGNCFSDKKIERYGL